MNKSLNLKTYCIYGLGVSGKSVVNFFKKKNIKSFSTWDDVKNRRNLYSKIKKNEFKKKIFNADFIIMSPGINLKKTIFYKELKYNENKIITDLDLFYLFNPNVKSIILTGTNGKSTACKMLEHILQKKLKVKLGGNIGMPILDISLKRKPVVIIEASSFQLAYSKFLKPDIAAILNITNDHLDWHGTFKNYESSKFRVFNNQKKNNLAFLKEERHIKIFKKNRFKSKLKKISSLKFLDIKNKIKNKYFKSKINDNNLHFIYEISKTFNIKKKNFIKYIDSFKGLEHRHEIFYKKKNYQFINDSKATSFASTKKALESNKNIYWILGGLPKERDNFNLSNVKKNIVKAYIIGKNVNFFKEQLKGQVNYLIFKDLKDALNQIFKDVKNKKFSLSVLLSPASASYDQYKNFVERGKKFKRLVKYYAKKNFI